jgi:plastocyanin
MKKSSFVYAAAMAAGLYAQTLKAAEIVVDQTGQQFSPKSIAVKVGDLVKFSNNDDVTHNITLTGPDGEDDLGLQKPGETLSSKLSQAGDIAVICHIHPKMKMKITVQ